MRFYFCCRNPLVTLSSIIFGKPGPYIKHNGFRRIVIAWRSCDDAIIDTENIFRRLRENKKKENSESSFKLLLMLLWRSDTL